LVRASSSGKKLLFDLWPTVRLFSIFGSPFKISDASKPVGLDGTAVLVGDTAHSALVGAFSRRWEATDLMSPDPPQS
jgi:hypothetical protein